jgi:hypothetical protein
MKKVSALTILLALATTMAFAEHWTGYVSDEKCATASSKAKKATDWINPAAFESCAQKCAKAGSALVFVTEDNKIIRFDAQSAKTVEPFLGHRVSLDGKLDNGALKVEKISGIKMETQAKPASDQEEKMHR